MTKENYAISSPAAVKPAPVSQPRDTTIDILRGLAIFTMIAANSAGELLAEPHPFWFRVYGSFAAPLFILMSGMMVALTAEGKKHDLRYFVKRGAMVVAVAVFIDVCVWHIYPFVTMDVLYLIGLALPLIFMFVYLHPLSRWLLIGVIFGLAPLLQYGLGYSDTVVETALLEHPLTLVRRFPEILRYWVVDGWFPIFPWLVFSFLGVQLARWRWKCGRHALGSPASLGTGAALFAAGAGAFFFLPGAAFTRAGYSELFYPPTPGFILSAIGLIIVLFPLVDAVRRFAVLDLLRVLGETSLFLYIVHLAVIEYLLIPLFSEDKFSVSGFMGVYALFTAFLILLSYGVRYLKQVWTGRPFVVRFLLGG